MAARYVNPSNVVAQGQDFYTGLKDPGQQAAGSGPGLASRPQQMAGTGPGLSSGSYAGHGGGGGTNVMGRGSGGSAGVSADRTGSDSSKSWNYKPQLNIQIERDEEKERGRVAPEATTDKPVGELGPGVTPTPWSPRQPGSPRQPEEPIYDGELVGIDRPEFPQLGRGVIDADWHEEYGGELTSGELPELPAGDAPLQLPAPVKPDQPMLGLPQYSEGTRATMDARNSRDRRRRASMIPASHLRFAAEEITKTIPGHVQPTAGSRAQSR